MNNYSTTPLSTIVLQNNFVIPVFEKYNLDFCCQGKNTLAEACKKKSLDLAVISSEIDAVFSNDACQSPISDLSASQLISHIVLKHHFYVKQAIPMIENLLEKLVAKHGEKYPYMKKVQSIFDDVKNDLYPHMMREEQVLFPRIKEIEALKRQQKNIDKPFAYINAPVAVMEMEHELAGNLLYSIRELTNGYNPPMDACTTHRVCLEALQNFEEDLHRHVHLENNVLFPMAESMLQTV